MIAVSGRARALTEGMNLLDSIRRVPLRAFRETRTFEASKYKVVYRSGALSVRFYSAWEAPARARVTIFPSFINRPYILDLGRGKSLIQNFLRNGIEVSLFDWGIPSVEEYDLGLQSLLTDRIVPGLNAVEAYSSLGKHLPRTLLGHCLGGDLALHFSKLPQFSQTHNQMVFITTPINFESDALLNTWFRTPTWKPEVFAQSFSSIPWPLMQASFLMLRPSHLASKWVDFVLRMKSSEFRSSFFQMELWSNDNVSFPSGLFRDFLIPLYRQNSLLRDNALNSKMRDSKIRCFAILGTEDHIVTPDSARAIRRLIPNAQVHEIRAGHIGALISKKTRELIWPKLNSFCLGRATQEMVTFQTDS